jgi:hypothetical protein
LRFPCAGLVAIMQAKPSISKKTFLRMPIRFSVAEKVTVPRTATRSPSPKN